MVAITPPNTYADRSLDVSSQARNAVTVTPSDSADLAVPAKALYIGSAGDIVVLPINATDDSQTVKFSNHPVGYLPLQVRRVLSTGTIASGIISLEN